MDLVLITIKVIYWGLKTAAELERYTDVLLNFWWLFSDLPISIKGKTYQEQVVDCAKFE